MRYATPKIKKILTAAALAGAFAAPAMAQTTVTVEGLMDAYVGSIRFAGDPGRTSAVNSGGLTTSWIGFKASEDLGNGVKANVVLTSFLRTDVGQFGRFDGGDTFWSRDANVGLSGNFGEVSVGRGLAPNFLPMILFNPLGDSFSFSPLVLHQQVSLFNPSGFTNSIAADTGWSNQIKYTTPSIGGLTANLHYQFGEVAGSNGKNNVGANVLYFNGPLSLTAFVHRTRVTNPGVVVADSEQKAWFVGGGYDFGVAKLFATYDRATNSAVTAAAGPQASDKTASLGLSVPVGAGKILAAYADTRRDLLGATIKRQTATVGYDYFLSKRTDLYALLMNDRVTGFTSGNSVGLGIRHRF